VPERAEVTERKSVGNRPRAGHGRNTMTPYLTTVWRYRYFWMSLVRMDLRTRYRRSLLGLGWSLLQPLAMTCILSLAFQQILEVSTKEYIPHLFTGLVCWGFIVSCAITGCQCFIVGEAYIRQCPLPLAIYPLRTALAGLFHFAMGMTVLIGVCIYFRGAPGTLALCSLVPTVLLLFVFGWSLAVLSGTLNVFFQDTQHLAEVCFQVLFYMTPIIYTAEKVKKYSLISQVISWNPVVAFLDLVREPLLHGTAPTLAQYLHALPIALAAAALAAAVLGRMQKRLIFYL
jgi:ABC-type polysaccharide/polyol phosphate export permease